MLKLNGLVIIYVILTSTFLSLVNKHPKKAFYLLINAVIVLWALIPFFISINHTSILSIPFDWLPLLLLPLFYKEIEILTTTFGKKNYDDDLILFENKYFSWVMDFHAKNRANSKLISEFLHACYLCFYLMIYGIPLYFYVNKDFESFYQFVFIILFTLCSCFLTHTIITACGPRNIFEKINDHRRHGLFFRLTHKILADGSSYGTAFPSGHTGVACVCIFYTAYIHSPLFFLILPIGSGLILSTIYGRFHYLIDAITAFFYALIAFYITVLIW